MKIVLAVDEDKKTIITRTGQAAYFVIYEDEKLIKTIPNNHHKHHGNSKGHNHKHLNHHEHTNEHKKDVLALKGCDVFLARAIGENMKEALESIGLKVKKIRKKDGLTADEVVKNFLNDKSDK
jgi:predicted Fe-Mo cluster-binding NifX family protein